MQPPPTRILPPQPHEHAPGHSAYLALVPAGDVLEHLHAQLVEFTQLERAVAREREGFRYAAGKWSICELVGHVVDMERVFGYRALTFGRGNPGPLPDVPEDAFVASAGFDRRGLASIARELVHLRRANLELFGSFGDAELTARGTASGRVVSVRALLHIAYGHAAHHLNVLKQRYLCA